jgi:DNA topoisomerase I
LKKNHSDSSYKTCYMLTVIPETKQLPQKKIKEIINDPEKSARAVHLRYVNDKQPGITRERSGDQFDYFYKGEPVTDEEILARIRKLVLPPAWNNVWICPYENGHLQATGVDSKNRKQYKYHQAWNQVRNQTKYYRMIDFGKALPGIRKRLKKDLSLPGFPPEKIMATIVSLMEITPIRVGNDAYEKLYGSYGLTTLKNKHARINGTELRFSFKGKKGVSHNISIRSLKLARIIKGCKDLPGKELFEYIDHNNEIKKVDSGMVNDYIRDISEGEFTTKDFRTWSGTVQALTAFRGYEEATSKTQIKKNIAAALDKVSMHLGNTRTVCKKYYVHPLLIELYETNRLAGCFNNTAPVNPDSDKTGLTTDERVLMDILSSMQ